MYLLVFVSLVIGLLGIYAQALSLQAARVAASQNGLALTMMTWHDAAVSMGASIVNTAKFPIIDPVTSLPTSPCSLTFYDVALPPWPTIPSLCPAPAGVPAIKPDGNAQTSGTVTDATNDPNWIYNAKLLPVPGGLELVHLPADYNTGVYQFYSVLYRDASSQPFIVTFVRPPAIGANNPAPGLLALPPTGNLINIGMSDLLHQLQISGLQSFTYGTVSNVGGNSILRASGFQYALPQNAGGPVVEDGSAAIISSPAGL